MLTYERWRYDKQITFLIYYLNIISGFYVYILTKKIILEKWSTDDESSWIGNRHART